ncbi:conserved membrane hypothetical protein [Vibrio chagasii]|nr:conserved membrane hypothetical protein [Vibrio chagasii]CAH6939611.1 conserved membrane hypothetical protein [Vibrio chagasii]CAH7082994.1 conserved membrane hypothetical protein [Vibrio chagasii]CAH7124024.1 conserved membrane hypothetical protein [Vibrio chagasii]
MESKSFKGRILSGVFWMSSGTLIKVFLQLFFMALLARLLSTTDYGIFAIVLLLVSLAQILTESGVGAALIQTEHVTKNKESSVFFFNLMVGFLLSFTLYCFSSEISVYFDEKELISILPFVSVIFILKSLCVVPEALLIRDMKFKQLAMRSTLSYVIAYGCVALPLAYNDFGVWSLVYAQVFLELVNAIFLLLLKKHSRSLKRFRFSELKKIFRFSSGVLITGIVNKFAVNLDTLLVGKLLGMSVLGNYNRAYQLMAYPANMMGGVFSSVLFPALSAVKCQEELKKRHYQFVVILSFILMPLSLLLFFISKNIVMILLGTGWENVTRVLEILSFAIYFRIGYKVNGVIARARGHVYKLAFCQVMYVCYVFVGCTLGANYGLTGIAFGMLLSLLAQFITKTILGCSISKLSAYEFLKAHTLGFLVCIVMLLLNQLDLILNYELQNDFVVVGLYSISMVVSLAIVSFFTYKVKHYSFIFSFFENMRVK